MAKNKIIFGNETLLDLTSDTVDAGHLATGYTAHDASGASIVGTADIPEVNDATLTIQRNGSPVATFTANDDTDTTANIIVDSWTEISQVANNEVTFTGLDDTQGWGYDPCIWVDNNSTNLNPYCKIKTITGAGTANMSITYETDADNGANVKLRILK